MDFLGVDTPLSRDGWLQVSWVQLCDWSSLSGGLATRMKVLSSVCGGLCGISSCFQRGAAHGVGWTVGRLDIYAQVLNPHTCTQKLDHLPE